MIVFDYAFYGKDKLWLKYYRRGLAYEVDTHRSASPCYTGQCYGRSPPSGAGREAAGPTSVVSSHTGIDPALFPIRILRAEPKAFTNGTIYVMRAAALTTFTLATMTTELTTMGRILPSPVRIMQSIWKSRAATKTDELSGVLTEDKDPWTPVREGLTLGKMDREALDRTFANGDLVIRIPP